MIYTYEEALHWIHSRLRLGIKPGLKRMEWMMEKLGHPERNIKALHVAGTNGKGSTVCYLRNILEESGYTVGTFTSPYFEMFNERISINGTPIGNDELIHLVNQIIPLSDELEKTELGAPSEFEVITAMAFSFFGNHQSMDFVIFETGLGGRLDSTNIVNPMLSIITNIGYDHMDLLGNTIAKIAYEKAGIIKSNVPVISSAEQPDALNVITTRAKELNSSTMLMDVDYFITSQTSQEEGECFSLKTPQDTLNNLEITMMGTHQVKNAALATAAILFLRSQQSLFVHDEAIRTGLKKAKWIGRFEQVSDNPKIILDGAHNPEGVSSLIQTIKSHLSEKRIHIIFSALKDKKLEEMIEPLSTVADSITFTSFEFPRVTPAIDLFNLCPKHPQKHYEENWRVAIDQKVLELKQEDVLLITGSLYFLSEVRPYIFNMTEL